MRQVAIEVLEEYIDLDEGKKLKTAAGSNRGDDTLIPEAQAMQSLGLNWDEL
ncbi:MAG: hypothetical protein ACK456_14370 [Pseudanabaenaceae cyanobacterium]